MAPKRPQQTRSRSFGWIDWPRLCPGNVMCPNVRETESQPCYFSRVGSHFFSKQGLLVASVCISMRSRKTEPLRCPCQGIRPTGFQKRNISQNSFIKGSPFCSPTKGQEFSNFTKRAHRKRTSGWICKIVSGIFVLHSQNWWNNPRQLAISAGNRQRRAGPETNGASPIERPQARQSESCSGTLPGSTRPKYYNSCSHQMYVCRPRFSVNTTICMYVCR